MRNNDHRPAEGFSAHLPQGNNPRVYPPDELVPVLAGVEDRPVRKQSAVPKWLWLVALAASYAMVLAVGFLGGRYLFQSGTGREPDLPADQASELRWAKQVAGHFLDSFAGENLAEVRAVSTKEYQERIQTINITGGPLKWTINKKEIGPNLQSASFQGLLEFTGAVQFENRRSFTIMVEKENNRWKVASFSQGPYLR